MLEKDILDSYLQLPASLRITLPIKMAQNLTGSQQRAFTWKRNKIPASEMRRQITGNLGIQPVSINLTPDPDDSTSQISLTSLNLVDVVEPVDIEDCLSHQKNVALLDHQNGNYARNLSDFPADDIQIRRIAVSSTYPNNNCDFQSPTNRLETTIIRDILRTYEKDLSLVHRRYQHWSSADVYSRNCVERTVLVQGLPLQDYQGAVGSAGEELLHSKRSSQCSSESISTTDTGNTTRENSQNAVVAAILQRTLPNHLDKWNENRRRRVRHATLMHLLPLQNEKDVIEHRRPAPFPVEHTGQSLLATVISLRTDVYFEPLFLTLALYDAKERRRISEDFHVQVNSRPMLDMLPPDRSNVREMTADCRQSLFSITYPSTHMFLVVKVEKVLQACEISEAADAYTRDNDKNRDRLHQTAASFCSRLHSYRMPLAWTAIDLDKVFNGVSTFEKSESLSATSSATVSCADADSFVSVDRHSNSSVLQRTDSAPGARLLRAGSFGTKVSKSMPDDSSPNLTSLRPVLLCVDSFFRQESDRLSEDDLLKMLSEMRKPGSLLKRLKCLPIHLQLELSGCDSEDLPMKISSESLPIPPFISSDQTQITREIAEFPPKEVYAVNCSQRNLLYIYPKWVNFSNRPGSARNITVKVQILDSQDGPMTAIFGKSIGPEFTAAAYTAVSYHEKSPRFYDEVKIQLPLDLHDAHHILFTFCHISCRVNKTDEQIEMPIGFAWIPLFPEGRLQTGDFQLPISLDRLPQNYFYLANDVHLPNIRWLDNHKSQFSVSLTTLSTVHTEDDHLDSFLRLYHTVVRSDPSTVTETDLKTGIQNLTKTRPEPLVRFLYVVLDKLLDLIVRPSSIDSPILNVAPTCFELLGQLVKILTYLLDGFCDVHGRSSLLTSYIHYHKIGAQEQASIGARSRRPISTNNDDHSPDSKDLMDLIKGFERSTCKVSSDEGIRLLHEELALQWTVSNGSAREMAVLHAW